MWFATWNGLSYYDGYSFHTFRDDPDGVSVLSTNRILSIQPTAANNVWCITQDRKLYLYDTHLCQFLKSSNQIKEKFNVDFRADHIYDIRGGNTWITSANSDYLLRTNDTDVLDIELIRVGQKGLKSGKVYYIYGDKNTESGSLQIRVQPSMVRNSVLRYLISGLEKLENMSSWLPKTERL